MEPANTKTEPFVLLEKVVLLITTGVAPADSATEIAWVPGGFVPANICSALDVIKHVAQDPAPEVRTVTVYPRVKLPWNEPVAEVKVQP